MGFAIRISKFINVRFKTTIEFLKQIYHILIIISYNLSEDEYSYLVQLSVEGRQEKESSMSLFYKNIMLMIWERRF